MILHVVPINPSPGTPAMVECGNDDCSTIAQPINMRGVTWFKDDKRKELMFCCYACMLIKMPVKYMNQA